MQTADPTQQSSARYQFRETLGKGGFGQVFKAWDEQLGRDVAIKVIHNSAVNIDREAKLLAKISSPNVVTIFDIINWRGEPAIVMEYVDNARALTIDSLKHYTLQEFIDFFIPLVEGVQAIHQENLLHGDIKLSNILLTSTGQVKLTDFGLAQVERPGKAIDLNQQSVTASWECLSPEQLLGRTLTCASDIYSLGIILFIAIFSDHPFIVENDSSKTRKKLQRGPNFKTLNARSEFLQLSSLCQSMLEKNPQKRPTVAQVLSALLTFKNRSAIVTNAAPTATIDIEVLPTKKWRLAKASLAVVIIAITLGIFVFSTISNTATLTLVVPTLIVEHPLSSDPGGPASLKQAQILAVIMDDELADAVVAHQQRRLIPKREWLGDRNWLRVSQTLQAEEILFAEVQCAVAEDCTVAVSLFSQKAAKVIKRQEFSLSAENVVVASEILRNVADDFLGNSRRLRKSTTVSAVAIEQYANLRSSKNPLSNLQIITGLEDLSRNNPHFSAAKLALGKAYLKQYDDSREPSWLKKARTIAELSTDSASGQELQFWVDLEEQNFLEASTSLKRLAQLPAYDHTDLVLNNAMLLFEQGDQRGAIDYLEEYPDIRRHSRYYYFKSYMLEALGAYEELLNASDFWLRIDSDQRTAQEYRLIAYLHLGQLTAAAKLGEILLLEQPSEVALTNLGLTYLLQNNFRRSIELFSQLRRLQPNNRGVLLNLADAHRGAGNKLVAENLYRDLIKKIELLPEFQWRDAAYLSLAYAQLAEPTQALLALQQMSEKAFAEDTHNNGMYFLLSSHIYELIDQRQAAIVNGRKALQAGQRLQWYALPWLSDLSQELALVN